MVMHLYDSARQDLADILYLWSAQSSLPSHITHRLLSLLRNRHPEAEAGSGGPDKVTLALIMALLNTVNLSLLHTREDGEGKHVLLVDIRQLLISIFTVKNKMMISDVFLLIFVCLISAIVKAMPFIQDPDMLPQLVTELTTSNTNWESTGLRGLIQFALGIAVATIKSAPNLCPTQNITEEDEIMVEAALANKAFHFIAEVLLKSSHFHDEEFYVRYMHTLISDFILLMPLKVKELRNRADESMRIVQAYQQEGIEPPMNLDNHFEYLMLAVAELYKKDPLKLNLAMDYWCQHSDSSHIPNTLHGSRLPPRQVALFKFVRLAGEVLPAGLFVSYLKMLASLASSLPAARQAFNFLKLNGKL